MQEPVARPAPPNGSGIFLVTSGLSIVMLAHGAAKDFLVYWTAGRDLLSTGWNAVYAVSTLTPFKYHPVFALFFAPWGALPFPVAKLLWAVLNGAAVLDVQRRWHTHWKLDATAIGIGFLGVVGALTWEFSFANVPFLMLWLWTVAVTSDVPWRQALGYAVLITLKPFWLALIAPWILARRIRLIPLVALMLVGLSLLPATLGIHSSLTGYERWIATFADPLHEHNFPKIDNQSWYALLFRHRESLGGSVPLLWIAGSALMGLLWLWPWRWALRHRVPPQTNWMIEMSVIPLLLWAAPLTWIHHQILLWPLLAFMWQRGREQPALRYLWAALWVLLNGTGDFFIGRAGYVAVAQLGLPILAYPVLTAWSGRWFSRHLRSGDPHRSSG